MKWKAFLFRILHPPVCIWYKWASFLDKMYSYKLEEKTLPCTWFNTKLLCWVMLKIMNRANDVETVVIKLFNAMQDIRSSCRFTKGVNVRQDRQFDDHCRDEKNSLLTLIFEGGDACYNLRILKILFFDQFVTHLLHIYNLFLTWPIRIHLMIYFLECTILCRKLNFQEWWNIPWLLSDSWWQNMQIFTIWEGVKKLS